MTIEHPTDSPSMDKASTPDPDEARRQLLQGLAEADAADAPDVADELADLLGDELDGPTGAGG